MKTAILLGLFLLLSQLVRSGEIPTDKNYSPARDEKLMAVFKAAVIGPSDAIYVTNLQFKKLRGYKVGGSLWDNEQWASIIEIRNNLQTKLSGNVTLRLYDASGFLLDQLYLFIGELGPSGVKKESNQLFIKLSYIDQVTSAELRSSFIQKP